MGGNETEYRLSRAKTSLGSAFGQGVASGHLELTWRLQWFPARWLHVVTPPESANGGFAAGDNIVSRTPFFSEVAQWERAGLITLRSLDRNQPSLP